LEHPDRGAIQDFIKYLLQHHQYSFFEGFYIETTSSFYTDESNALAEKLKDNPKQFFKDMEDCIESEVERAKAILPISAWNTVREFAENAAWRDRVEWLAKTSEPIYPYNLEYLIQAFLQHFRPTWQKETLDHLLGCTRCSPELEEQEL
jgi:cullin-4